MIDEMVSCWEVAMYEYWKFLNWERYLIFSAAVSGSPARATPKW